MPLRFLIIYYQIANDTKILILKLFVESMLKKLIVMFLIISLLVLAYLIYTNPYIFPLDILNPLREVRDYLQQTKASTERTFGIPLNAKFFDSNFQIQEYVTGLSSPTSMAFINNDMFVLEKNTGNIILVRDGQIMKSLYTFDVSSNNESGLLGITSYQNNIYVYVTEFDKNLQKSIGNNIYSFFWNGDILQNRQLLNSLSSESSWHNGGAITHDLDGNIFAVIGDQIGVGRDDLKNDFRILQNVENGEIDDSGVIVKIGKDKVVQPKFSENPLEHYRAIGIRNSFGLAVDPYTNNLWDTENGPENFDEINLISENFNSGWSVAMGPATKEQISKIPSLGKFEYSDPEFSWEKTVSPTGLTFVNSDKFSSYDGDLIVASCNYGILFKFSLNDQRNGFNVKSEHLKDLVVNDTDFEVMDEIKLGEGFGCMTDVDFGPDGNLYITSFTDNTIYRILPNN